MSQQKDVGPSRRTFLSTAASAPLTAGALAAGFNGAAEAQTADQGYDLKGRVPVTLKVNGQTHEMVVDPRLTLVDALREHIGLTGTKVGCNHGQCGACTVHKNGERVLACLTLAVQADGAEITTIEGLANGETLHPMQAAFVEHDAYQCGYCTPGQIMSAVACIREGHAGSDGEIREYMSGNLCRCAAYVNIVAAIKAAKTDMGA